VLFRFFFFFFFFFTRNERKLHWTLSKNKSPKIHIKSLILSSLGMSYKMREKCAFLSIADCTLVGQRRRPKTETETEGNLVSADERLTKDGRTEWNGMGWNRGSGVDGRNGKKKRS